MSPRCHLVDQFPVELVRAIFMLLTSTTDYANLSLTCRRFQHIGNSPGMRTIFLKSYFAACTITTSINDTLEIICRFIEASGVKPCSKNPSSVAEQIPTNHFISYMYGDVTSKRAILDLFRPRCLTQTWTIPTLGNRVLARAKQATRHMTQGAGPRRVYYDVTINATRFYCVFLHVDMVVAFEENDTLSVRYGRIQYEDEGIVSTTSWDQLFKASKLEINNMPLDRTATARRNNRPYPVGWKPSLLRTFVDCTLLRPIRKGGLLAGERYKVVFMYEHQEDDTICLEFCEQLGGCLRPRGYLLMVEHDIIWSAE
ncbi:hypothetical protein DFQ28_007555 [Apophysomyces sp. BC1034]|nr:hypothetical protein DFQ30_007346 [Apophysomyces sp. BC1015]KAG0176241.1 hypothetical protein DFQ29_006380 [Apophysomyces sp. BC1021]KAG0186601.1 hypothetical protein DFQ28_007555 [Apophysomyces sp. BC1034]